KLGSCAPGFAHCSGPERALRQQVSNTSQKPVASLWPVTTCPFWTRSSSKRCCPARSGFSRKQTTGLNGGLKAPSCGNVLIQSGPVNAVNQLVDLIESADGAGLYPEGPRSRDGRLSRARTAVGWLALTTGAPVVPVGLVDTDKLQPPGKSIILPRKFEIRVGEPVHVEKLGPKHGLPIRRETTDRIMQEIAKLTGQERVDSYNKRPDETAS